MPPPANDRALLTAVLTGLLVLFSGRLSHAQMTPVAAADSSVTIAGQVVNAVSKGPITRALVQVNDRVVLTDREGKFSFDRISSAGSTASLRVNKQGYYATPEGETQLNTSVPVASGSSVRVSLYPETILAGTLSAPDGTPLPRVSIMARRSTYNTTLGRQWIPAQQHMTNSRGEFRLALPPGDYRIETGFLPRQSSQTVIPSIYPSANSPDASSTLHLVSGAEERINLHADVGPSFTVAIRLDGTSEAGFPMLMAHSSSGATMPLGFMRSQDSIGGSVQLPMGTYTISANRNFGENGEYGEAKVTVTGPNTPPVIIHLSAIPIIPIEIAVDSGATSDKTSPSAQQLGLMLVPSQSDGMGRPGAAGMTTTRGGGAALRASPGSYRLVSTAYGAWVVSSASYGGVDLLSQEMTVAPGGGSSSVRLTVSNRTGSASGRCRLNGSPGAAWIYLVPLFPSATPIYMTRSSATGAFAFNFLPEGSYRAIAFEQRHLDDYRSTETLARYTTWTRNLSVTSGSPASIEIDAVPMLEMQP